MVNQGDKDKNKSSFDLNKLRGWQRSQLVLLKDIAENIIVSQRYFSNASGARQGSHELGGKLTAFTRADLIRKAGKDDNGQFLWALNQEKCSRKELLDFLNNEMGISKEAKEYIKNKVKDKVKK